MLFAGQLMVDLNAPVIVVARRKGTIDIVKKWRARYVRRGNQGDHAFGHFADAIRGDNIVRKRRTNKAAMAIRFRRCRIENGERPVGEIAIAFLQGG